jgi:hypothetical protein
MNWGSRHVDDPDRNTVDCISLYVGFLTSSFRHALERLVTNDSLGSQKKHSIKETFKYIKSPAMLDQGGQQPRAMMAARGLVSWSEGGPQNTGARGRGWRNDIII